MLILHQAMEGYLVYVFLGVFLALSLLIYANMLIFQFFELRFGYNEKTAERIMHGMLVTSLSFMWYSISLSFTLYNKWILQEWHGGFHFPIMITTVHMIMKYFITRVWALTPEAEQVNLWYSTVIYMCIKLSIYICLLRIHCRRPPTLSVYLSVQQFHVSCSATSTGISNLLK